MPDMIFKNKKLNFEKLLPFGFTLNDGVYTYTTDIMNGQFHVSLTVLEDGSIHTKIIDSASDEEYVLHRALEVSGAFVGAVRADYEAVLLDVAQKCFEPDVFKSDDARKVIRYIQDIYHDEPEFLWQRFPGNAIFRRRDTGKWYAALLILPKRKLGFDSDEIIEILDLRLAPCDIESTVDGKIYLPGYHMNKKNWYTICLDGSVPSNEIFRRIDVSYKLAVK